MNIIDKQTKSPRLQIIDVPDNKTDLMCVDIMKKITCDDKILRKTPEYVFTPMCKLNHIWFENEPSELKLVEEFVGENKIYKSRKTYEIKSNFVENFNELDEYREAKKLFDEPTNILNFSNLKYLVVFHDDTNLFYLMNNETNQIFKFDFNDIEFIHHTVYGPTYSKIPIKSISVNSGKIKYNFGEKKFYG